MDGWMKLLARKVNIQGMTVLLADKVQKQEPHNINVNGYTMFVQYSLKGQKQEIFYPKRTKTSLHKKISKRNPADVRMVQ